MKVLQKLHDAGTVIEQGGRRTPVRYDIEMREDDVPLDPGVPPVPGVQTMSGRIESLDGHRFPASEAMILELADGRKLKFFFQSVDGDIGVEGWTE